MTDPFVVVGGDAAGLSAASKLKREAPDREVMVFEKGRWVSYAHCGMPYYVKGEVDALGDLLSLSPAEVRERGIDLRRRHEVVGVDTDSEMVAVETPEGRTEQPYGDLLVATGARAVTGPFDTGLDGAFTLHHMDEAAALRAFLLPVGATDPGALPEMVDREYVAAYAERDPPGTAAVVGGGYVGVETAEALAAHGLDVHVFQRSEQLLPPFGEAVGERVAEELARNGVTVHTDTPVRDLLADGDALAGIEYSPDGGESDATAPGDTRTLPAELAVVGVGVRPNTDLLEGTPVERGASGAVATDEYGRTSVDSVYAAGDCAEARHVVTGEPDWVPLGLTANRAGRAIGRTVAGDPTPVGGIAGTAVVKAFDLGAGRTGLLAEAASEAGFDPVAETVTAASRSGYYPGAADTTVTMVADAASRRVLGASVVGTDRAAKRIDTVATALESGLTVDEVERLDLAYAPPFSPVWDPVLVAAKVLAGSL